MAFITQLKSPPNTRFSFAYADNTDWTDPLGKGFVEKEHLVHKYSQRSTFLEEYNSLKKFRSSLRISFGSLILVPLWLIKDDICFRQYLNFSKLRKYLLFFSPCSYQRALFLIIAPRVSQFKNQKVWF